MNYDQWEAVVDRQVKKLCGVGIDFLIDTDTREMYERGLRPSEAAHEVLAQQD